MPDNDTVWVVRSLPEDRRTGGIVAVYDKHWDALADIHDRAPAENDYTYGEQTLPNNPAFDIPRDNGHMTCQYVHSGHELWITHEYTLNDHK